MLKKLLFASALFLVLSFAADAASLFPSLDLKQVDGSSYSLKSSPGAKVVVFFASWSKSCINELKALEKLYSKYKKEKLEVIAVSFDDDLAALSDFVKKEKLSFTVLHDAELISPGRYEILVIPTTYILKPDLTVKSIFVDFDDNVNKSIEGLLQTE